MNNILEDILKLDNTERFKFGKYKDKLIASVAIADPKYFSWLADSELKSTISNDWRTYIESYAKKESKTRYAGSYNMAYYKSHVKG